MDIFEIDMNELDREWTKQPGLFYRHATRLAEAREGYERAKAEADLVRAETETRVRADPEKHGLTKVTEGAISAAVTMSPDMRAALDMVRQKRLAVDTAQAVVTALDHRKAALEKLVSLHGQNYFSSPVAAGDMQEAKASLERRRNKRTARRRREEEDD